MCLQVPAALRPLLPQLYSTSYLQRQPAPTDTSQQV